MCSVPIRQHPKHAHTDVFAGLGKVAERSYTHLLNKNELSIRAIGRATGQHPASVSWAIKRLRAFGMVGSAEGEFDAISKTENEPNELPRSWERWVNQKTN